MAVARIDNIGGGGRSLDEMIFIGSNTATGNPSPSTTVTVSEAYKKVYAFVSGFAGDSSKSTSPYTGNATVSSVSLSNNNSLVQNKLSSSDCAVRSLKPSSSPIGSSAYGRCNAFEMNDVPANTTFTARTSGVSATGGILLFLIGIK